MTRTLLTLACALALPFSARADITLLGSCSIPGDALDKSNLTNPITETIPHNLLGSLGSAIDYTGKDDLYLALNDRGPGDGKLPFRPRFQTLRITIDPAAAAPVTVALVGTTLLSTESGDPLTGLASAFSSTDQRRSARFDPEGLRISSTGTLLISDEYGPWIDEFSREGRRLRRFPIPAPFLIAHPDADPGEEFALNTSGRRPNHGFEGLALSPDKSRLFAILQAPLLQDSTPVNPAHPLDSPTGINCRILELTLATGAMRQLVYQLDKPSRGVSELLAITDNELLVLERDGGARKSRSLFRINISRATDVSSIPALPPASLPPAIVPVSKSRWLDLCDPRFALAATMPEKIEGLTFGPTLADGRRTLIVTSDNDLKLEQPTWFWVFAIDPAELKSAAASTPTVPLAAP